MGDNSPPLLESNKQCLEKRGHTALQDSAEMAAIRHRECDGASTSAQGSLDSACRRPIEYSPDLVPVGPVDTRFDI